MDPTSGPAQIVKNGAGELKLTGDKTKGMLFEAGTVSITNAGMQGGLGPARFRLTWPQAPRPR